MPFKIQLKYFNLVKYAQNPGEQLLPLAPPADAPGESHLLSINNTRCNCPATAPWPRAVNCKEADRRTMEETRGGEEERTTEGQGDGWGKQLSAWSPRENDRTMEKRRV